MGGLIPLSDASRRPVRAPVCTALIIIVNSLVFLLELTRGEAFVTQWSLVPAQITSGHQWITILTAMFMHGSWSHIIGNMGGPCTDRWRGVPGARRRLYLRLHRSSLVRTATYRCPGS